MARQLSPLTRSEKDRRELIVWAIACAQRLLPIFEQASPHDRRPREALEGALAFAHGELRIGPARALAAAWQRAHLPERFARFVYPEG